MSIDWLGLIIVLICGVGYFWSWRSMQAGRFSLALLSLIFFGLILRVFTATDTGVHEWDERYHALVAKNMMEDPFRPVLYQDPVMPYDYQNWTANHIWVHKQPLPLWAMAASLRVFGVSAFALRLPSILLSALGIWLLFSIAQYLFGNRAAYFSALFFSVNGLIIEITAGRVATDHFDLFFLVFILMAVWFSIVYVQRQKWWYNVLVGVAMGAAILSKWLPALIVLPIWASLVIGSGRFNHRTLVIQGFIILCTALALVFPWQWHIYHAFPLEAHWEAQFNLKHITEVLDDRSGPVWYFFDRIRINYGELIYLPLGWFTWRFFKDRINFNRLAVLVWFWVPFLFFSAAKTKMQGYILFTAPALFMMTAVYYLHLDQYRKTGRWKWLAVIVMLLIVVLPFRYSYERIKPLSGGDRNPAWVNELKQFNQFGFQRGVMFHYQRPVEAMFYTNLTVYPDLPDQESVERLKKEGYTVILYGEHPGMGERHPELPVTIIR